MSTFKISGQEEDMFKKLSNGCVHLVNRFLPDPFIFCIILTVIVFVAAMPATGMGPITLVEAWGTGAFLNAEGFSSGFG